MKSKTLDECFDAGDDITADLGHPTARRPNLAARRVNVDLPIWTIEALDREAKYLGVTRQSVIKMWLAERLERLDRPGKHPTADRIRDGQRHLTTRFSATATRAKETGPQLPDPVVKTLHQALLVALLLDTDANTSARLSSSCCFGDVVTDLLPIRTLSTKQTKRRTWHP